MNMRVTPMVFIFALTFMSCANHPSSARLKALGWLDNPLNGPIKSITSQSLAYKKVFGDWGIVPSQIHECRQQLFAENGSLLFVEHHVGDSTEKSSMYAKEAFLYDSIGRLDRVIYYDGEGKDSKAKKIYHWDSLGRPLIGSIGILFHFDGGYPCATCGDKAFYTYIGDNLVAYGEANLTYSHIQRDERGLVIAQRSKWSQTFGSPTEWEEVYRYLKFDEKGNWTKRIQYLLGDLHTDTSLISDAFIEKRKITYY